MTKHSSASPYAGFLLAVPVAPLVHNRWRL